MTALPSFVELMASLGLDHGAVKPDQSTRSSPTHSPRLSKPGHTRSKSTQCFREMSIARHVRYSPYSPGLVGYTRVYLHSAETVEQSAARRGSLSSTSSSPELDLLSLRVSDIHLLCPETILSGLLFTGFFYFSAPHILSSVVQTISRETLN